MQRGRRRGHRGSTWHDDRLNLLIITLHKSSEGAVEDGTEIQSTRLEAVRRLNVGKVQVTYRARRARLQLDQELISYGNQSYLVLQKHLLGISPCNGSITRKY